MIRSYQLLLLAFLPFAINAQSDTISIFYEINAYEVSVIEKNKLDLKINTIEKAEIIAYTDYLGSTTYNLKLSQKRADALKKIMLNKGLNESRLIQVIGKGEIGQELPQKEGVAEHRRSDLIIHYNQLDTTKKVEETVEETIEESSTLADEIKEVEIGENLIINNLSFVPGHHYLLEESLPTLESLISILKENPKLKIQIEGHVCCSFEGKDGFDQQLQTYNLSEERAKHIYLQLIENGIDSERLSYVGLARTNPIYPHERDALERQANRRVEIKIIDK